MLSMKLACMWVTLLCVSLTLALHTGEIWTSWKVRDFISFIICFKNKCLLLEKDVYAKICPFVHTVLLTENNVLFLKPFLLFDLFFFSKLMTIGKNFHEVTHLWVIRVINHKWNFVSLLISIDFSLAFGGEAGDNKQKLVKFSAWRLKAGRL